MVALRSRISSPLKTGFTLVELSIVLVIIGLIIGGIVVGRDLIDAATIRSQISQIEKYQTAVNTFRGKYGYLPGDIPDPAATQYGFVARGQYAGEGDGNGLIEGVWGDYPSANSYSWPFTGETVMFWADLSKAGLVDGSFTAGSPTSHPAFPISSIALYMPQARIGLSNYISILGNGSSWNNGYCWADVGNYFSITQISTAAIAGPSSADMTVQKAYAIDTKIDDGFPLSGRVIAIYVSDYWWGAAQNGSTLATCANSRNTTDTVAASASSTTCLDNGGNAGTPMHYSTAQNNGAGINCALSFQFQ